MMGEELQESEVIFPDPVDDSNTTHIKRKRTSTAIDINRKSSSQPVNIPQHACSLPFVHREYTHYDDHDDDDYDDDDGGSGSGRASTVVPPHLIVARRVAAKTTCSFFEHSGKPLKGRNLSQVRNCILRMTGFLEA